MKHILIAGCHRSGSTYVGKVLSKSGRFSYIQEPCNMDYGLQGIKHWYPYASSSNPTQYNHIVDTLFENTFSYKSGIGETSGLQRIRRRLIGSRPRLYGWLHGLLMHHFRPMLIKDPLASMSAGYFHQAHAVTVILLVRHPAAFYKSLKRMNWRFDFANFLDQPELMENHLERYRPALENPPSAFLDEAALLWLCIYQVLFDQFEQQGENCLIIRHEDICLDPLGQFGNIFDCCGIPLSAKVARYIRATSVGGSVEARGASVHDFHRNAAELAFSWRSTLSETETGRIKEITGDLASKYYGPEDW